MKAKIIFPRKKTRSVTVGKFVLGDGQPIRIQSMTKVHTRDVRAVLKQIARLETAGCEIVRVACATDEDVKAIGKIRPKIHIPLVADIHFNHRFAIEAIEQGVDKLRINPGNIGNEDRVAEVVEKAKKHHIPIRIGVNARSLEKDLMEKLGPSPEALESARRRGVLERHDFRRHCDFCESDGCPTMIRPTGSPVKFEYPLHLGVTEAGTLVREVFIMPSAWERFFRKVLATRFAFP